MPEFKLGTIQADLPCVYGSGKDFRSKEPAVVEAGLEVTSRHDDSDWHFFTVSQYGRGSQYAIKNSKLLDAALGFDTSAKADSIAQVKSLMVQLGLSLADLS